VSRTAEEILALYVTRKARLDPMHRSALEVRAAYYGDITLPLPEIDRNEKPLVANLLFSAGEQKSMRVASTFPDVYFPSTDPGAPRADLRARQRRLVNLAWYDKDAAKMKMRKRARHMVYYASSPTMIRPHLKERRPTWQIRNPLTALAPELDVGEFRPEDVIFTYTRPYAWLLPRYPQQMEQFGDPQKVQDGLFTVLEYQDADENVLCVVGTKVERSGPGYAPTTSRVDIVVELNRAPNRVGQCTAVFAGGIGLDHARGGYDGTIGLWQAMGKIMALEAIGLQRSIWPETWIQSDGSGEAPSVITQADPLAGVVGEVSGGKLITVQPQINQGGLMMIDRLERYQRIEGGTPAELGGESTSNIRTGRRGDQILSSVLDFPLQEMQEILALSLQEENKVAIAIDKAYFPTSKSIYLSATAGEIDYEANQLWETDTNFVKYSHAGVDAQGLVVELGQLVGTGLISKRSAMESHPAIEDVQSEFDRMTQEHLRDALLNGIAQMSQDPTMAPVIAQIAIKNRGKEIEIEDAVLEIHQAIQQMQAQQQQAQAAQAQQMGPPGMPGPEAQPGMAAPQAPIGPPPEGLTNLTALLGQLRRGQNANVPNQLGIAS
jgi:hypothetical protein